MPLGLGPSLTVVSRLLHPYSTEVKTPRLSIINKTPRLMSLHSQGHSKRFTELYREDKREEEDKGDQEEKGRVKRGENNQASKKSLSENGY